MSRQPMKTPTSTARDAPPAPEEAPPPAAPAPRQRIVALAVIVVLGLFAAVAVVSARVPTPLSGPAEATGTWIWNDPQLARTVAAQSNKPILIDFWASWCTWCKKMDDETYTDARVRELLARKYVPLRIDVDKLPALQEQFQARGLPTMVVVDLSGKELGRLVGFRTAEQFLPFLRDPQGGGR